MGRRIVDTSAIALAKMIAFFYGTLGGLAIVLGVGLLARFWTLQQVGGGLLDQTVDHFFMRLLLPFLLAARVVQDHSAIFLLVIGFYHLVGGILLLRRW